MRHCGRGLALAVVLFVVFAVLVFGMMLASLSSFQYQLTAGAVTRDSSLEAAQAGMAQSIYNLTNDATWGTHREAIQSSVATDGGQYQVSFVAGSGAWSVNNLAGGSTVSGYQGQLVPPYTALVVSQGSTAQGSHPRTTESLLQYAPFPYAIMASSQVSSAGPLVVSGSSVLSLALLGQHDNPGSVYAGSSSASAVTGGALSLISGKVRTPGNAVFGAGSQVVGGINAGIDAETVPNVNIAQYEDSGFTGVTEVAPGATLVGPVLGVIHAQGDLTLAAAILTNAYIYVEGNLTSTGAMLGTGSIFVAGKATLEGAVSSDAGTGIAVFSQQDLNISTLIGGIFQGVLYSHGNLTVQGAITVLGGIIAQSDTGAGNITLDNGAIVVYVPEYTQFANAWSNRQMLGSAVNGTPCLMQQLFWRECSP